MKKVIPKKKDAFRILSYEDEFFSMSLGSSRSISASNPLFQSPSFQLTSVSTSSPSVNIEVSMGVAGKNIHTGDVVMLEKNGLVVPFRGPEGRSNV